ncbi:MAG: NADH-quinone oxidoreductase subunit L [Bacteroidetes bacterium]|nr:NADH-quinone oxidoreductase subunit L [Bacteroidota bacterium]
MFPIDSTLIHLAIAVLILPLVGFVLLIFFGKRIPRQDLLETGILFLALAFSIYIMVQKVFFLTEPRIDFTFRWIDLGGLFGGKTFPIDLGIAIDNITAIMLVVVTLISSLVHLFSLGYMHDDIRYSRYYAYLGLFTFSMLGIVLSNNILMVYVFWELVGLSSYLLIGHWYEKKSASDAGKKAFIVNRVGDIGFFVGILIIYTSLHTFLFTGIFSGIAQGQLSGSLLTIAGILIFCGAVGKSAQFPLHVWLPDAMEGPTPVSALIHAATMVAAGVYLIARVYPMLTAGALTVIAYIGAITAFISATIAITQNDIKKVLAYSTISQLGYMVMGLGVGAFSAGVFHLVTHAAFKAGLFLASGSVIYAMHHEQDMRQMGGLRKKMPITYWAFVIFSLSISGIPFTSGFLSKDSILAGSFAYGVLTGNILIPIIGYSVVFLTAFYMFRLIIMTFHGEPRDHHKYEHAKESPAVMTIPLIVLAALSLFVFYSFNPFNPEQGWFLHSVVQPETVVPVAQRYVWEQAAAPQDTLNSAAAVSMVPAGVSPEPVSPVYQEVMEETHYTGLAISLTLAVLGLLAAFVVYDWKKIDAEKLKQRVKPIHTFLYNKWYFDELYGATAVAGTLALSKALAWFDGHVIDGTVNGAATLTRLWSSLSGSFDHYVVDGLVNFSGWFTGLLGRGARKAQTGKVQTYIVFALLGVIIIFFAFRSF